MKALAAAKLPFFGGNFLAPGNSVIHFYFTEQERLRFVPFLAGALRGGRGAVLAAPAGALDALSAELCKSRPGNRQPHFQQVEITADLPDSLRALLAAVRQQVARSGTARVLIDFAGLVTHEGVFEVEADLSSSFRELRLTHVTQYDGNSVSATVTLEQFKTHSLAVVGDAFYYENRRHISPEVYFRRRATAATAKG
ncbi:MAG TPA: hypothetical protein VFA60_09385 [Terriglobales bacterium]|nr:hypothetical protein [Terriglobales bacterium]